MSEQAPISNEQIISEGAEASQNIIDKAEEQRKKEDQIRGYLANYPKAVEDPEKARFMAEATKSLEMSVITNTADAKNKLIEQDLSGTSSALRRAKDSRSSADYRASEAAELYDTTEPLIRGENPRN